MESADSKSASSTFAEWQQEQDARAAWFRNFHFYSTYCYYYALYSQVSWPGKQAEQQRPWNQQGHLTPEEELLHILSTNPAPSVRIVRRDGIHVTPAPVTLRLFAELLDFLLIYLLKDVVYSAIGMDGPELILEQLDGGLQSLPQASNVVVIRNLDQVVKYTVLYRLMVMVYETLFLAYGLQGFGGATIGKRLVGLSVIHCTESVPTSPSGRTLFVSPGGNLGLWRSFLRSLLKVTILFVAYPIMISILFNPSGRTMYDQISSSVVVVTRRVPVPQPANLAPAPDRRPPLHPREAGQQGEPDARRRFGAQQQQPPPPPPAPAPRDLAAAAAADANIHNVR